MSQKLYHVRYKKDGEWKEAYFETENAAEAFTWHWRDSGRLAEYKGRREGVKES